LGEAGRQHEPHAFNVAGEVWWDMTQEARRARLDDDEVQASQHAITLHSDACLASADRGIAMLRRLLGGQEHAVTEGDNPADIRFDPDAAPVVVEAGSDQCNE
jgi:hypothetical protein